MLTRLPVALMLLAACSRTAAVTDENIESLRPLAIDEELRIGDVDDPDTGFSRIGGVDVDRDGNVFVVEAAAPEIRVYGPDGALIRRFGRRGGGPGEFDGVPRIGVIGDTVWAVDSRGVTRLTLFDREGTVLATGRTMGLRVPLPGMSGYVRPWFMRPDGKFTSHFSGVVWSREDPPTGVEPTDSIPVPHVLFDVAGEVTDTVGWADRPPPRVWSPPSQQERALESVEVGGRRLGVPRAPTATPWWEPLREGYVLVETPLPQTEDEGIIRIVRVELSGDTVFASTLRHRAERWTSEELDSIAVRAARGEPGGMAAFVVMRDGGRPPVPDNWQAIARELRGAMAFPDFKLPIQSVWVAQDESVWLRRSSEQGAPAQWMVLDAQGRPRGRLEIPANVRVVWSRDDALWAVVPDENDIQWLVRYRVRSD